MSTAAPAPDPSPRAFTSKAIIAGLVGATAVCGLAIYNEVRLRQPNFLGSQVPAGAICYVLLLGTAWNLGAARLARRAVFSARELVVVLGCALVASGVAVHGLHRTWFPSLVLPWFHAPNRPSWLRYELLEQLPPALFPSAADSPITRGLVQGLGPETTPLSLPWAAWLPTLGAWLPLLFCLVVALLGLALLLHRQWAHHEQLAYPLAGVMTALFERSEGRVVADLFHSKLFWLGFTPVFGLHLYNLFELWLPDLWPNVQLIYYIQSDTLYRLIPSTRWTGFYGMHEIKIFFFLIGIAYFLPSSTGFSLGIAQALLLLCSTQYFLVTGEVVSTPQLELQRSGAFVAYALVLLFTGRHYYGAMLRAACGFGRADTPEGPWAARCFLVGTAGFWLLLVFFGLDWLVAACFTGLLLLLFLVVTRLICETGLPIIQAGWTPASVLPYGLGPAAIGLRPLVIVQWFSGILANDTREALLPYFANSLKTADAAGVRLRRFAVLLLCAVVFALGVAGTFRLWSLYRYGATQETKLFNSDSTLPLDAAARQARALEQSGLRTASDEAHGLGKLRLLDLGHPNLRFAVAGFLAVLLLALLRLRFLGWPLHPVFLMVWGTAAFNNLPYCLLAGWLIKVAIVRLGGGKAYHDLKPLFLGLIVAEIVAAGTSLAWGFGHHFVTGLIPRYNLILPEF